MATGESTREFMQALLRVQVAFRGAVQRSLKQHGVGLTFEMLQIMVYLWNHQGTNQQELAAGTFKDKASLTSILHNLESKGLIRRSQGTTDKRSKIITLTDQGCQCAQDVKPVLQEVYMEAATHIDASKMDLCTHFMDELKDVFKQ